MTDTPSPATPSAPHGLQCPVCRVDLVMTERQGIEIDYCPKCRGVWLDRGELDKIIERTAAYAAGPPAQAAPNQPGAFEPRPGPSSAPAQPASAPWGHSDQGGQHDRGGYDRHGGRHGGHGGHHGGGPGGFLERLFR